MSKPDEADEQENPLAAIRALVEENGLALETLDTDVLTLDDIVWRSPARQVVDPTDIIKRLAEEADYRLFLTTTHLSGQASLMRS